jgi:hypothetical protein
LPTGIVPATSGNPMNATIAMDVSARIFTLYLSLPRQSAKRGGGHPLTLANTSQRLAAEATSPRRGLDYGSAL